MKRTLSQDNIVSLVCSGILLLSILIAGTILLWKAGAFKEDVPWDEQCLSSGGNIIRIKNEAIREDGTRHIFQADLCLDENRRIIDTREVK